MRKAGQDVLGYGKRVCRGLHALGIDWLRQKRSVSDEEQEPVTLAHSRSNISRVRVVGDQSATLRAVERTDINSILIRWACAHQVKEAPAIRKELRIAMSRVCVGLGNRRCYTTGVRHPAQPASVGWREHDHSVPVPRAAATCRGIAQRLRGPPR